MKKMLFGFFVLASAGMFASESGWTVLGKKKRTDSLDGEVVTLAVVTNLQSDDSDPDRVSPDGTNEVDAWNGFYQDPKNQLSAKAYGKSKYGSKKRK